MRAIVRDTYSKSALLSSSVSTPQIDTATPGGKLIFHLMGALTEFERDLIELSEPMQDEPQPATPQKTVNRKKQCVPRDRCSRERSLSMLVEEPSLVLIDGRRIAYDEVSSPHPKGTVLLLAGADSNRLTWYKQLDVFGRAFRTIAVDCRDTGDSDPVSEPYTIADLADDAAFVLAALGVQRAHVVGVSLGGYVGLQSDPLSPKNKRILCFLFHHAHSSSPQSSLNVIRQSYQFVRRTLGTTWHLAG